MRVEGKKEEECRLILILQCPTLPRRPHPVSAQPLAVPLPYDSARLLLSVARQILVFLPGANSDVHEPSPCGYAMLRELFRKVS